MAHQDNEVRIAAIKQQLTESEKADLGLLGFKWYDGRDQLDYAPPKHPAVLPEDQSWAEDAAKDLRKFVDESKAGRMAEIGLQNANAIGASDGLRALQLIDDLFRHLEENDGASMNAYTFAGAFIDGLLIPDHEHESAFHLANYLRRRTVFAASPKN